MASDRQFIDGKEVIVTVDPTNPDEPVATKLTTAVRRVNASRKKGVETAEAAPIPPKKPPVPEV